MTEPRTVIITGAGSGIGRAMALRFAAIGDHVIVADLHPDTAAETVELVQDAGGRASPHVYDAGGPDAAEPLIAAAVDVTGRLDVLVNNAGIMDRFLPVAEVEPELWNAIMAVNLTGPYLAMRAAIPHMVAAGGGVIVNTASAGGLAGGKAGAAYTASKHGLVGLTKNTAFMYAKQGIRCNAIAPGPVLTNIGIGGAAPSELGWERVQLGMATMPEPAAPDDIAGVAVFLASDAARFVNGAVLPADGAWLAA